MSDVGVVHVDRSDQHYLSAWMQVPVALSELPGLVRAALHHHSRLTVHDSSADEIGVVRRTKEALQVDRIRLRLSDEADGSRLDARAPLASASGTGFGEGDLRSLFAAIQHQVEKSVDPPG